MRNYLALCRETLETGRREPTRTGIDTLSNFGRMLSFDMRVGFPLVTSRRTGLYDAGKELFMFLNGITSAEWLKQQGCNIWNEWAYTGNDESIPQGELGPIYGRMWRAWPTADGKYIDQFAEIDQKIAKHSTSRRMLATAWNVDYLPDESAPHNTNIENGKQVLPPCHTFFQVRVNPMTISEIYKENDISRSMVTAIENEIIDRQLPVDQQRQFVIDSLNGFAKDGNMKTSYMSLLMYARSQDLPLGTPYNIASYGLLLELWAAKHNMQALNLIVMMGDVHIYEDQIETMREQLTREPRKLPKLKLNPEYKDFLNLDITKIKIQDVYSLVDYDPHPPLKYPSPAV